MLKIFMLYRVQTYDK